MRALRNPALALGLVATLCALSSARPASTQDRAAPQPAVQAAPEKLEEEYAQLDAELKSAQKLFYKKLQEKEEAGKEVGKADFADDPTPGFLPRFRELSVRAKGTGTGARCLMKLLELQPGTPELGLVDELLASYVDSPALERLPRLLSGMSWTLGSQKCEEIVRKLAETSTHKDVQAASWYTLGTLLMSPEQRSGAEETGERNTPAREAEAKRLLVLVQERYADTKYAERAAGALFEVEHLGIGKEAPDFKAVDENGKEWKLSDYRGKVVVIDFWGEW